MYSVDQMAADGLLATNERLLCKSVTDNLLNGAKAIITAQEGPYLVWITVTPSKTEEGGYDANMDVNTENQAEIIPRVLAKFQHEMKPAEIQLMNTTLRIWNSYDFKSKALCIVKGSFKQGGPEVNAVQVYDLPWAKNTGAEHCPCGIVKKQ